MRHTSKTLTCCLVTAVFGISSGNAQVVNKSEIRPAGHEYIWGKLYWGMTLDQAAAVYKGLYQVNRTDDGVNIGPVPIASAVNTDMVVVNVIRGKASSGMIGAIMVSALGTTIIDGDSFNASELLAFKDFRELLLQKYGAPKYQSENAEETTLVWITAKTVITLFYVFRTHAVTIF